MGVLVLYGSATGKAESIAELLGTEAEKRGLNFEVKCMSEIGNPQDIVAASQTLVVVSSTTGDGEQPETAAKLFRALKRRNMRPDLSGLRFAYLGLGDTNYTQFCNGPKTMRAALLDCGAQEFYPPGWADDGTGLEAVVEPWVDGLWKPLENALSSLSPSSSSSNMKPAMRHKEEGLGSPTVPVPINYPVNVEALIERLSVTTIAATNHDEKRNPLVSSEKSYPEKVNIGSSPEPLLNIQFGKKDYQSLAAFSPPKYPLASTDVFEVKVAAITRLTADAPEVKRAYQVTVDLEGTDIHCEPGDSLGVICANPGDEVDVLIERLNFGAVADLPCSLAVNKGTSKRNPKVPDFIPTSGWSLRRILTEVLDIRSVPKKKTLLSTENVHLKFFKPFLRCLVDHTSSPKERRRLMCLCSREGASEYLSLLRGHSLCLLDVLLAFPTCQPPAEALLEHLPRLAPRPYSAASIERDGRLLDFVFNVAEIPSGPARAFPRRGICTGWFEDMAKSENLQKIRVFGRSNTKFRHPTDLATNVLMVGPGTGVAPFRGFLQLREKRSREENPDANKIGSSVLFFGCRHSDKDFLFRKDFAEFIESGALSELIPCFSRDPDADPGAPRHVQDNIRLRKEMLVRRLLEEDSVLYVCGDARNMARQVMDTVTTCISEVLSISEKEAKARMAEIVVAGKYLQDVWT